MAHGSGLDAILGFAAESTYGTRVAPTRFIPFESESLELSQEFGEANPLQGGIMVQPVGRARASTRTVEGSIEMGLYERGMGLLFNLLHGKTVTPEAVAGATGAYKQVHEIGTSSPVGKSLSIQVGRPMTSGTVQPFDYTGCKITEMVIGIEAGGDATVTLNIDGRDEETDKSLASPSWLVANAFTFKECVVGVDGSQVGNVRSAEITIPLNMATDRFHLGNTGVKDEPLVNEHSEITISTTLEFQSMADHNRFRQDQSVALEWVAVGSTPIVGATYPSVGIQASAAKATSSGPAVEGPDLVTSDVEFAAKYNGTDAPLTITTVSDDNAL